MRLLGVILAIVFIALSSIFSKKINYQNQKIENGVIKQPPFYSYVGILGVLAFVTIAMIFFFAQNDIVAGIVMLAITLPYIILIVWSRNWKITFDNNGFYFTNIIKKQRHFLYKDVKIENTTRGLRIYIGKKKILAVSFLVANVDTLYSTYIKWHREHPFDTSIDN